MPLFGYRGSESEQACSSRPDNVHSHDDIFEGRPGKQRSGPKGVLADKRWDDFKQSKLVRVVIIAVHLSARTFHPDQPVLVLCTAA